MQEAANEVSLANFTTEQEIEQNEASKVEEVKEDDRVIQPNKKFTIVYSKSLSPNHEV